ncbi:MAG: J domain-containing protein [Spirochaetota bacterium]
MRRFDRRFMQHLSTLGLDEKAGPGDIQAAYRARVMALHPDVNRSADAPRRFREAVEAYGALMEELRSREAASGERIIHRVRQDSGALQLGYAELEHRMVYSVSPQVRASAAAAGGLKGGREGRELLLRGLRDSEKCVRNVSVCMLARSGEPRDLPALLAAAARTRDAGPCRAAWNIVARTCRRFVKLFVSSGSRIFRGTSVRLAGNS